MGERGRKNSHVFLIPALLPPLVSAQPSPLLHGQTVTLDCNAERPNDDLMPEIHWLNPQGEKMQQGRNEVKAERRHSGQWTCVVTHGQKSHTAQTSVTVIGERHAAICVAVIV